MTPSNKPIVLTEVLEGWVSVGTVRHAVFAGHPRGLAFNRGHRGAVCHYPSGQRDTTRRPAEEGVKNVQSVNTPAQAQHTTTLVRLFRNVTWGAQQWCYSVDGDVQN